MTKKWARVLLTSLLTAALFTGCSSAPSETKEEGTQTEAGINETTGEKVKVSLLVTGSFGDKAFNDSAQEGMKQIAEQLGDKVEVEMIEMGHDKTKFEGALLDASESDSDVIIVGTWDMKEILEQTAPLFPEKKYIIFDTDVDYASSDLSNVYSMSYKQNEAAFLAGVLAASATTSDMTYANEEATIGFVGAKDTAAVINDSAVGFIEGAQFINPDIKVIVSYVGSYVDSAKAKELALTQYASGADCVFVAAGPASVGVIEAAAESQKYVIGVDSDQALAYEGSESAEFIISSAIKGVGTTIFSSVERELEGQLPYGTYELLGLAENAVGLADNDIYQSVVPEEIRTAVEEATASLLDGKVSVSTAYGMDEATLKGIISSAQ
ncbi:MAG: BMP family ABC transporter substrate-binding protein [Cellulosilyticum sp.]|nr:BMP family ABC transporter substrate-binding protein [Cellulosilyticum sp.]